jgi:hypothetical protein
VITGILVALGDQYANHRAAANTAGSASKPQAQDFASFHFAMWVATSSSFAHPMKYRQIIS